jgi:histidinol dehydrogenase
MPHHLDSRSPGFEAAFARLLAMKREDAPEVDAVVADIIADVRARGDAAVIDLTARFDRLELTPETLAFSAEAEIEAECAKVPQEERGAGTGGRTHPRLPRAADAGGALDRRYRRDTWLALGPVAAAGLYVPGGIASYPSSVLMNAIPARSRAWSGWSSPARRRAGW